MSDRVIAYHGTPITPAKILNAIGARDYCVSFYRPDQVEWVDQNSRSWFGDNGIFSAWRKGIEFNDAYWQRYYEWCRKWCLHGRCSWVVIPDPIGTGTQELDYFLREWPSDLRDYGVPVYHLDEPLERCVRLVERFGRVAVGATGDYEVIMSPAFMARMDDLFDLLVKSFGKVPPVHFFRGLQLLKPNADWPISSADSTAVARNHNVLKRRKGLQDCYEWAAVQSVNRWDNFAANRPDHRWPPDRRSQLDWVAV